MKGITEERLKELVVIGLPISFDDLLSECKEIDTLTVSKLRPMHDLLKLKDYKTEVLATRNSEDFMRIRQSSDDEVYCFEIGKYLPALMFIGWVPNIIYKPEQVSGDSMEPKLAGLKSQQLK